jgi:Fe-S-cluster containining protein
MKFAWIIDIILIILFIYFVFIHEYILGRRKFKCIRCGKCCKLRVNLPEEDIIKIKKAGYKDFLEKGLFKRKNQLKKVNGYCIFLTLDKGVCSCKLENSAKPNICRNFPAISGCFGKKYDLRCNSFQRFK